MIRREMSFALLLAAIIASGLQVVSSSDDSKDDEYIRFLVEHDLHMKNNSRPGYVLRCSGRIVPHPNSEENICICERGKGFKNLDPDRFCSFCNCGERQISCKFNPEDWNKKLCYCDPGYEDQDEKCVRKLCLNGGATWESDDFKEYKCTCLPGYAGMNCETEINPCEDNRCQNNGVCWRGKGTAYWCDCPPTHTGQFCETEIHKCDQNPCWYGGTCFRGNGSDYICSCPETHTGTKCETEINPCDPNPCRQNEECYRGPQLNYLCRCTSGLNDTNCKNK